MSPMYTSLCFKSSCLTFFHKSWWLAWLYFLSSHIFLAAGWRMCPEYYRTNHAECWSLPSPWAHWVSIISLHQLMGSLVEMREMCLVGMWHWNRLHRKAVDNSSLEVFRARMDRAWSNLVQWKVSLPTTEDGIGMWRTLKFLQTQTILGF